MIKATVNISGRENPHISKFESLDEALKFAITVTSGGIMISEDDDSKVVFYGSHKINSVEMEEVECS